MICRTCKGSGSIMSGGMPPEWWTCPACGGDGVRILYGPKIFARIRRANTECALKDQSA